MLELELDVALPITPFTTKTVMEYPKYPVTGRTTEETLEDWENTD